MIPVKRLEIVTDAPHMERVVRLLARHGLRGWTLIRNVTGSGERGHQLGDEVTGVSSNHLLVTTCPPEATEALLGDLKDLLARYGGVCIVSDAHWLAH